MIRGLKICFMPISRSWGFFSGSVVEDAGDGMPGLKRPRSPMVDSLLGVGAEGVDLEKEEGRGDSKTHITPISLHDPLRNQTPNYSADPSQSARVTMLHWSLLTSLCMPHGR
jgi:hypothetical protein